jgi:hypothetical protein
MTIKSSYFILLFVVILGCKTSWAQREHKISFLKSGVQFNKNSRNNFYFEEVDYAFDINTFKYQRFYKLRDLGQWDFIAIPQLQYQYIRHQLLNKFFVQEFNYGENFLEFRERFMTPKTISFFAFEIGFQLRREILSNLHFEITAGLGAGYIDTETERVAKGFTFLENLSFGLAYPISSSEIYLGFLFNHISNFNTQIPNSGYNSLGWELGFRF